MAKKQESWQTVSLKPLIGVLDTRSRPADIPPGGFRWKLNIQATDDGKICTRDGFLRAWSILTTGAAAYQNQDWHHRGATRDPINFGFESTQSNGTRTFWIGSQSRLASLNEGTGQYTTQFTTSNTSGTYFTAADATSSLGDLAMFSNGADDVQYWNYTSSTIGTVPGIIGANIRAAKIIVQYQGFTVLLNVKKSGSWANTTVQWSDFQDPFTWDPTLGTKQAGFQDLPYGDEILAAIELLGALYILTRRSIWRMTPSNDVNTVFNFTRVYSEPINQKGCIVFPRTLISDGQNIFYASREAIYYYNPYISAPMRPEQDTTDWMHRASGAIYRKADTAMNGTFCYAPVAAYRPLTKEFWISWPSAQNSMNGVNDTSMVFQLEQKTADVVDAGFTMLVNYRRNPIGSQFCNEAQSFLGGYGLDYCLKDIGSGFFYREVVFMGNPADPTQDCPLVPPTNLACSTILTLGCYQTVGYYRILRGMIPLGLTDRQKKIRDVILSHDDTAQLDPCNVRLKIGNSFALRDPNDPDNWCAVQWRDYGTRPMACEDVLTLPQLAAKNLKPAIATEWAVYDENRFLYFWFQFENSDGSPAIGCDSCLDEFLFDIFVDPKSPTG